MVPRENHRPEPARFAPRLAIESINIGATARTTPMDTPMLELREPTRLRKPPSPQHQLSTSAAEMRRNAKNVRERLWRPAPIVKLSPPKPPEPDRCDTSVLRMPFVVFGSPVVPGYTRPVNTSIEIAYSRRPFSAEHLVPRIECPSIPEVIDFIARRYNTTPREIRSMSRALSASFPRQIACYVARRVCMATTGQIGKHLGDRDHSTVCSAEKKIKWMMRDRADFAHEIALILRHFEGE